ncbi:hypothetical protein PVAG01_07060 [Phlyctema vagabunda]|uniref:Uncharacterized protein n=1 Tax=Phlyctema vagabunda TaxID=108571 RepID=A0ABR4PBD5_9HELO
MGIITHYSSSFLQPSMLGLSQTLRSYVATISPSVALPTSQRTDILLQIDPHSDLLQQYIMALGTACIILIAGLLFIVTSRFLSQRSLTHLRNGRKGSVGVEARLHDIKQRSQEEVPPYQMPPLRSASKPAPQMAMALKKLDQVNWLTLDHDYLREHDIRSELLRDICPQVVQQLTAADDAAHEVLSMVVHFLTSRYPSRFTVTSSPPTIHNHLTSESYPIGPTISNPLEISARLAMEDFNILKKDTETGEYQLIASATLFPTGWKLQERIGSSMAKLHAPVPGWKEKLGRSVNRYFDYLSPNSCMERTNTFVQTSTVLFADEPAHMFPQRASLMPEHVQVRRERQTFTRLVGTDAILFTVRTFMRPLTELDLDETRAFAEMVRGWEEGEMGKYKGSEVWGETALRWCDEMIARAEGEEERS